MKLRYSLFIILAFALFFGNCQANDTIVGKWIPQVLTKGGLGDIYIFHSDGQITLMFGAIIESTYILENDYLIETFQRGQSEPVTEKYLIKKKDDKLILEASHPFDPNDITARTLTLHSLEKSEQNESVIIGKWFYEHPRGGKILTEYTKGGKVLRCLLMGYKKGRYTLEKNNLTISLEGKETYAHEIEMQQEKLIFLPKSNYKEKIYIQFH